MRKSIRRTTPRYLIPLVINIFIICGCLLISFFIFKKIKNNHEIEVRNIEGEMESQKIHVYEAKEDIARGHIITKGDLVYKKAYSSQGQAYYVNEKDIGLVSKIDIKKGTYLLKDMLVEDSKVSNLREIEYNIFLTNSNLAENDYVDLRVSFPNGEDYIILSKKNIKNLNKETGECYLWLTEEEILNVAGAIVDTHIYPDSKIYTSRYIEPALQEPSDVNYKPNLSTLAQMQKNTNILRDIEGLDGIFLNTEIYQNNRHFRNELELRLQDFYSRTSDGLVKPTESSVSQGEDVVEYGG